MQNLNNIDLLIKLWKERKAIFDGCDLKPVITESVWRNFVYKCLCEGVTKKQVEELQELGFTKEEIYEKLNIGKNCRKCIEGEENVSKESENENS
jgi:bacterioferritin-associated ferredoxin